MKSQVMLAVALGASLTIVSGGVAGAEPPSTDAGAAEGRAVDETATLEVGWITPPQGLDPHLECHIGCRPYWLPVFETLYDVDFDANIVPLLAADFPTYSADGLELTIPLREGRTFRDGTPVDADAVKASIERGRDLEGSTVAPVLERVASIEIVDPLTVKLVLDEARPNFEAELAGGAGAVISPAALADRRDLNLDPGDAGSGPYEVESIVANDSVTYTGDPDYWLPGRGEVGTLVIRGIADVNTGLNGVQAGQLDAAYGSTLDQARRDEMTGAGLDVIQSPSLNVQSLMLRITRSELGDVRVRQALAYAIDRETINDTLYEGTCEPISQAFPAPLPVHIEGYDPFAYDPEKARQLLADAGLPDGFGFELITVSGNPTSEDNAAALQQMFAEIGVDAEIVPMTSAEGAAAFRADELDARSTVATFRADALGTVAGQLLTGGPDHMAIGEDGPLVELIAQLNGLATDSPEALEIYQQIGEYASENVFHLPICVQSQFWVAQPDLLGMTELPYTKYGVFDPRGLAIAAE